MIIRLNKNCMDKRSGRFYFDFADCRCSVNTIYDKNLELVNNHNQDTVFGVSNDNDILDDFDYDDSLDRYESDEYDEYDESDEYDEYDEYDDNYFNNESKGCLFEFDTPYICVDNDFLYELYALKNGEEVMVLFRKMELEYKGTRNYQEIIEDVILDGAPRILFDMNMGNEVDFHDIYDIKNTLTDEDARAYIVTQDYEFYMINCVDACFDPDDFFEPSFTYSVSKVFRKDKYSLEEFLEMERMEQNCSNEDKYVLKKRQYRK